MGDPADPHSSFGKSSGTGYWCSGYQWGDLIRDRNGKVTGNNQLSNMGFGFRNCTDWAAFRAKQITGVQVPYGAKMGNAKDWDDNGKNVPGFSVDNTPDVGDIAVWEATKESSLGHVAVVESVNEDGTVNVSEYNKGQDGNYGTRPHVVADHYLDINGTPSDTAPSPPSSVGPTFMSAMVQRASGETDVAAVGPNNSLDFYYNFLGDRTWTRMTIPGAQAFSSPVMVQRPNGETDIVVQGPNHSLDFYFNEQGSLLWHHLVIAAAGEAYSGAAMVQRPATGETDLAIQGPNNSLIFYYNFFGGPNWGRVVVPNAQAASTPAMVQRPTGETDIAVQGPANDIAFYYNFQGSLDWGKLYVTAPGWGMSAPAMVQRPSGETDVVVEGPQHSLDFYVNNQGLLFWMRFPAAGANTTFSSPNPPVSIQRPTGETDTVVRGPGDTADFYYNFQGVPVWNKVPVAVGGYSLRQPAMVQRPTTGETDLTIIGLNNRLDFYLNVLGDPHWANLPIAGEHSAS